MAFFAAVGTSSVLESREAGKIAVQQALGHMERAPVSLAWIIASHVYQLPEVLAGAAELIGEAPVFGFSTSVALSASGQHPKSVVAGLFFGDDLQARSAWQPYFGQDSQDCTHQILSNLSPSADEHELLLVAADGLNGDPQYLTQEFSKTGVHLAGCLAGGEIRQGRTYQMGGRAGGSSGLAAAVLKGKIAMGVGAAHGWRPVGALARLTQVQGQWVRQIDEQPASETYAKLFGYPARDWSFPPLNHLVRLYPLGVRQNGGVVVRAPLRVEADGSLRMGAALPENALVEILVGTQQSCLAAAQQAVQRAQEALGASHARLAVLLVDEAWRTIFELEPGAEVRVVRELLGEEVPLMGGYTFGQIARPHPQDDPQFLNQHLLVALFG